MNIINIGNIFASKQKEINTAAIDEILPIDQLIKGKKYPFEKHTVQTKDGYILTVFRIPHGKSESTKPDSERQPVLFQHGIIDSADGWVCNEESKCLPFIMANNNCDVWLMNSRGSKHSKEHKKYDNNSFEFWQFSFEELGQYDIPAVIDYIKQINKSNSKIIYFGHSQGTTLLFSALSLNNDHIKENIKLFIALAPVVRLSNISPMIIKLFESTPIHKLFASNSTYEIFPENKKTEKFYSVVNRYFPSLINNFMNMLSDEGSKEFNDQDRLGVYFSHYPAGTSLKSLNHFIQIFQKKKFTQFDYLADANFKIYGQIEPPEYNLKSIKDVPIMLIAGSEDKISCQTDVEWLKGELGDNVIFYKINPKMGHATFLVGKDIDWFKEPLEIIKKYID